MRSQAAHTALIPSQQIDYLILVVILCAEGKQKAHTAVVIPSYAEKGNGKHFPHTKTNSYQIFDLLRRDKSSMRSLAAHRLSLRLLPLSLVCGACFLCGERKTSSAYKERLRRENSSMRLLFPFCA